MLADPLPWGCLWPLTTEPWFLLGNDHPKMGMGTGAHPAQGTRVPPACACAHGAVCTYIHRGLSASRVSPRLEVLGGTQQDLLRISWDLVGSPELPPLNCGCWLILVGTGFCTHAWPLLRPVGTSGLVLLLGANLNQCRHKARI